MASVTIDKLVRGNVVMHNHSEADLGAILDSRYVNVTGDTMTPVANSTTTFNITNSAGTSVFDVDTTNRRIGFGTVTPSSRIHIAGNQSSDYGQFDAGLNLDQVDNPNTTGFSAVVLNQAGNINAGVHYYAYTLVTPIGETRITNPVGGYTFDASNAQATVNIPVSSDYRVTARKIYRTKAGESQYTLYLLATINDNTTTTYTDNIADSGLGTVSMWYRPNTTNAGILVNGIKTQLTDQMSTFYGYSAGGNSGNLGGYFNDCFGASAGTSLTTGGGNALFGSSAGQNLTIYNGNSIFGSYAGYNVQQGYNALFGYHALWGINGAITGAYNTVIGTDAGYNLKGAVNGNVMVGYQAGFGANTGTTNYNVFIGFQAGKTLATSNPSNKLNIHNADSLTPLIDGLFSGVGAGLTINSQNTAGVPLIVKGIASQASNLTEWRNSSGTVLGGVEGRGTYFCTLGTTSNLFIGTGSGNTTVTGTESVCVGAYTGDSMTSGGKNVLIGHSAGTAITSGSYNIALGRTALPSLTEGSGNFALGYYSLGAITTQSDNVAVGNSSLRYGINSNCVGIGTATGQSSGGTRNTFIGDYAGGWYEATPHTGMNYITAIGAQAGYSLTTNATTSTLIGTFAGYSLTTGSANVFIGYSAGYNETTNSNKLYIANSNTSTPLIYGDFATPNLTFYGGLIVNEEGIGTYDFRVESDTEANMLFLDANADTDGALYLGGTTNGIKINKGGVLTFLGTANISGGATGTFTTADAKTVTVTKGIITSIV